MGFFNMIETFFFISLGITFVLILLLVYHFKHRLSTIETETKTMFQIVNGIVKELSGVKMSTIQIQNSLQDHYIQLNPDKYKQYTETLNNNGNYYENNKEENIYNDELSTDSSSYKYDDDDDDDDDDNNDDDNDNDDNNNNNKNNNNNNNNNKNNNNNTNTNTNNDDDDDDDDNNDDDNDNEDEESSVVSNYSNIEKNNMINKVETTEDKIKVVNIELTNEVDSVSENYNDETEEYNENEYTELIDNVIENIVANSQEDIIVNKLEESPMNELEVTQEDNEIKEDSKDTYKKMNIHQLRAIIINYGLASDTSKIKKQEAIKILEEYDASKK